MYCTRCGVELKGNDRFCSQCGTAMAAASDGFVTEMPARLVARDLAHKKIAGVCAGVARYLAMDVTLVRLIWFLLIFAPVPAIIAYIVCWIVLPVEYPAPTNSNWETAVTH